METTNDYYNKYALEFFNNTLAVDMKSIRQRFLAYLPDNGRILDAGCGSGRDTKAFLDSGYYVKAFDASPALAQLAEDYIRQSVDVLRFQDLAYDNEFDGIWACASLLHVSRNDLPNVFRDLFRALKPDGLLYSSFKYGTGEVANNGRSFTNMNEDNFTLLLDSVNVFKVMDLWVSEDRRQNRQNEYWFNAILKSKEGS